jgi:hypothetical protein
MTEEAKDISTRGTRVNEILAAYLQSVDAGKAPSRQELLARHPDLAAELQAFFADHDELDQLAGPVRPAPASTPLPQEVGTSQSGGRAGDPTLAPGETAPAAGTRLRYFGDYELLEEIARGGMGVVFKARQLSLGRVVALKMILSGQLASEADVRRFRTEAEAAGNLDHPNIVPIYEVGDHQGQHYFSMKLMEGGCLAVSRTNGGVPAPARAAAKLLATVARAVHHAHQRGLLHRDLKPANILLDGKGEPHVTDFGLVKRVEGGSNLTGSGAIVGTPSYMAPEQAGGKKGLTTAVDVYSLGAILYELLTGQPPFRAETPLDTLLQVLEREPARPRQLNQHVSRDLETICLKCLNKDPQRRYATAEALALELERWLAGEPIQARPTGRWERAVKWARRRPAASALVAVSGASAFCLFVLAGFLWHNAEVRAEAVQDLQEARREQKSAKEEAVAQEKRAADKRAEVDRLEEIAQREREGAREARETGRRILYAADMQLARAAWETDSVPGLVGLLERHVPGQGGLSDLRGFEWNYLWRLGNQERFTLRARVLPPEGQDKSKRGPFGGLYYPVLVAISPDGKTLASASVTERIKLWDMATGKPGQTLAPVSGPVTALRFAPDGKGLLAVTLKLPDKKGLQIPDFKDVAAVMQGKAKPTLRPFVNQFAVQALPLDGGAAGATEALDPARLSVPLSIFAAGMEHIELIMIRVLPLQGQRAFSPMTAVASPDGKLLAMGGLATFAPTPQAPRMEQVGAILLWDLSAGREKALLRGPDGLGFVTALAFAPDGKTLA